MLSSSSATVMHHKFRNPTVIIILKNHKIISGNITSEMKDSMGVLAPI
jgi:hypothetical protein